MVMFDEGVILEQGPPDKIFQRAESEAHPPLPQPAPLGRRIARSPAMLKHDLDTPSLLIDLDLVERNIAEMAAFFRGHGVGWRPHTKGQKVPEIAHMELEAGALGITCAKLGEAEVMAEAGIRDILIANQGGGAAEGASASPRCSTAPTSWSPSTASRTGRS